MIPIQLTAVAANENMGVMAWLLGDGRAIPDNYLSLELNEAQINWFNASSNYNDVVINAAKEARGQGFVTEFAGPAKTLESIIWTNYDEQNWTNTRQQVYSSFGQVFEQTYWQYASFDGFWDAVEATVTLPDGLSFEDFKLCPNCYSDDIELEPSAYLDAVEENVIEPFRLMQGLFDDHAYATRVYTTMSASDMTLDPVFAYNEDLDEVSNVHTAERIIECNPNVYEFEAPWRIELPQGGVIRGTAEDAAGRVWPDEVKNQPANFTVSQLSESGKGEILVDNADEVEARLQEYNESLDLPGSDSPHRAGGCSVASPTPELPWAVGLGLVGAATFAGRRRRRGA
jgi:MYXO-CTERM domain-containing protein